MNVSHNRNGSRYDLAIVGGGILGLSLAFEITRRNLSLRVALLDSHQATLSASVAAGAMLSGFGETTTLGLASEGGRLKAEWRVRAANLWPAWVESLNENQLDNQITLHSGTAIILNAVSGTLDDRNYNALLNSLMAYKEPFDYLDGFDIPGMRPTDAGRPLKAIYIPRERYVDATCVISSLIKHLEKSTNIDMIPARCLEVAQDTHGHRINSTQGSIFAKQVIVTSGAESLNVLQIEPEIRSRIPPLISGVGTALVCRRPESLPHLEMAIRTPNRSFSCGLHVLPSNRDGIYIGATNTVQRSPAKMPIISDVGFLINCATQQIDRRINTTELISVLTGYRPVTLDTFPLLGETSVKGLWLLTGTYRDGFHLSPLIAKLAVDALESGKDKLDGGEIFIPERRPLPSVPTLTYAVEMGVENYIGIATERGAVYPSGGSWEDEFKESVVRRVEKMYKKFGSEFMPSPDLLWDIEHGELGPLLEDYCMNNKNF